MKKNNNIPVILDDNELEIQLAEKEAKTKNNLNTRSPYISKIK